MNVYKEVDIDKLRKAIKDNGFRDDYIIEKVTKTRSTWHRRLNSGAFTVEEIKQLKKLKLV